MLLWGFFSTSTMMFINNFSAAFTLLSDGGTKFILMMFTRFGEGVKRATVNLDLITENTLSILLLSQLVPDLLLGSLHSILKCFASFIVCSRIYIYACCMCTCSWAQRWLNFLMLCMSTENRERGTLWNNLIFIWINQKFNERIANNFMNASYLGNHVDEC